METQNNDLAIENDNLREDIHARDVQINVLQHRLHRTRFNLMLAAAVIADGRAGCRRIAHLQREAAEDGRAISTLTRELATLRGWLAEERAWSSYYHDISDSLAGELQRIDAMLAGVGFEARGDETIADRVARLIRDTLPRTWGINEESALYVPALIACDQQNEQQGIAFQRASGSTNSPTDGASDDSFEAVVSGQPHAPCAQ